MRVELAASLMEDDNGQRAEEILRRCVHCGFCNATCPTFNLLGDELDGPRGRIYLMKEMFESDEVNEVARTHLDRCLTCRNCETTCPSGVEYGELLELGRNFIHERAPSSTFFERVLLKIVPHYRRLRLLVRLGRLVRWFLPISLSRTMPRVRAAEIEHANTDASVTLLQGCAQRALTPSVTQHLAKLLQERDVSFRISRDEKCCGGLHLHRGREYEAKRYMTAYVDSLYTTETEKYVSTATGCGVTVKDYGRLLGTRKAREVASRTVDASEFLEQFSFSPHSNIRRVALHTPCTLQHGQRVKGVIESILVRTGYELVPTRDDHLCCGSAGTYSFLQEELSEQLLAQKLENLQHSTPDVIATANVGCQLHLDSASDTPVVHWLTLLN